MNTWEERVNEYGEPTYGFHYFCKLKCHSNKSLERYALLKAVDESDYLWEFDGDEISNNWYVVYWIELCLINKVQRERTT